MLGKIHSINIEAVGLGTFGKTSAFYIRQLKTFSKISAAQQQVKDPRTGRLIEPVLYFKDLVDFYENDRHAPGDRSTLIHGDYRIGNLIWHKTEPRVIGVLDWELSTIGHPLSDVASLIDPYSRACFGIQHKRQDITSTMRNRGLDGIPDLSLIIRWYTEVAGWNPDSHLWWGSSFHAFRDAIIMQGIMARMAAGQASGGSSALSHAARMKPDAERAWKIAQALLKPVSSKL